MRSSMPNSFARAGSSGSPARKPSGPPSTMNPSTCSVAMIPPARRSLSRTVISNPAPRVSALDLNAHPFRERLVLDVDVVEDLDVITDEANRHEQYAVTPCPGQAG